MNLPARQPGMAQLSADTLALIHALRSVASGATITYEQLTAVIGRDIFERRSSLGAARRALVREERICFDVVRTVGLRRLDDAGTAATLPSYVKRIRRASTRARRIGQCVDVLALPADKRAAFVGDVSLLALVSEVTAPASSKRLELAASSSPTPPAILAAEAAWNALRGKKEAP